ncbi:MAG: hypothetical protein ABIK53_05045 [bacterium]
MSRTPGTGSVESASQMRMFPRCITLKDGPIIFSNVLYPTLRASWLP